ncbi:hypothetical protein TWF730_007481 [Orbilia blumenaviensis]|uniref:Uncharacterized protein n=1 Tax=Orbilia blumenaviensis TaxID=1796055 RepID=A0AAV9V7W6_9PEZI
MLHNTYEKPETSKPKNMSSFLRTATIIITSFGCIDYARAQGSNQTTLTIYETVQNTNTITSIIADCETWTRLPQCDQVTWPIIASNTSTSASAIIPISSSTVSTPATTSISAPQGGFVLEDSLFSLYFQFDDDTGRAVLADPGQDRLVALSLEENDENLLQNYRDPSEIVFARYNASENSLLGLESTYILSTLREIRYTADKNRELQDSDYVGEWVWNTETGQVELYQNGKRWLIYKIINTTGSPILPNRGLTKRGGFYNLYLLPADIAVSQDSVLQRAEFAANNANRYDTSGFSSLKTTSTLASLSVSASTSTSFSKTGTATISPTGGNPSTSISSSVSGSTSTTVPDAYDLITSLSLEGYCTSLLSYASPITTTTSISTSISTSYYALFTGPSTTSTSTKTVGDTTTTVFVTNTMTARRAQRDLDAGERSPEDELTSYPSNSIISACSRAVVSPTGMTTDVILSTDFSYVSEPTSSTIKSGVANDTTSSIVPIFTETIAAIGAYKLVHSDLSDHSGTYYGQYLTGIYDNTPGYTKASLTRPELNWMLLYFETVGSYALVRRYSYGDQSIQAILTWAGEGDFESITDVALYEFPLDNFLSQADRHAVYFHLNSTTLVLTPDNQNNPTSDPVFYICSDSMLIFFVDETKITTLDGYDEFAANEFCVNTGLTAVQGGF